MISMKINTAVHILHFGNLYSTSNVYNLEFIIMKCCRLYSPSLNRSLMLTDRLSV